MEYLLNCLAFKFKTKMVDLLLWQQQIIDSFYHFLIQMHACTGPTAQILPLASIVSLVVQSGAVLGSTIANLMGCRKNCGFSS